MSDPEPEKPHDNNAAIDSEELVRANIGWMLALAERLLRDRGLAADVVQESFIRAFGGLSRFEGRSTLESWLHRITVNSALSRSKNRMYMPSTSGLGAGLGAAFGAGLGASATFGGGASAAAILAIASLKSVRQRAMSAG